MNKVIFVWVYELENNSVYLTEDSKLKECMRNVLKLQLEKNIGFWFVLTALFCQKKGNEWINVEKPAN